VARHGRSLLRPMRVGFAAIHRPMNSGMVAVSAMKEFNALSGLRELTSTPRRLAYSNDKSRTVFTREPLQD
jgi:hypothetical protein